ncbi:homoserine kinase [Candidatus Uhrbacteria bacterium]|nr:homoserine kinase [Candidatus Uhrbacteria bacterium]
MHKIKVFAPATVANVGPGFDVFGFAVEQPGDEVVATLSDTRGVRVIEITGDNGLLSKDADKNTAAVAAKGLLEHLGSNQGIELSVHKKMPLGSGLGSSAASAVAGVVAANELLGAPLSRRELLPFTMEGERVACGAAHADNVAPSLLGGFILIRSYDPLDVIRIPTPENLWCTVVHPHIEVRTEDARRIMPKEISIPTGIAQWGNTAGLIAGLFANDLELIGRSLVDHVAEPARSQLIPGFTEVKKTALRLGALGSSISGSGPSVFALSDSQEKAKRIGQAMHDAWTDRYSLDSDVFVSQINKEGPRIISQ